MLQPFLIATVVDRYQRFEVLADVALDMVACHSGIEVPDALCAHCTTGKGKPYGDDQAEDMVRDDRFMTAVDRWTDAFVVQVGEEGSVEPGRWRAYGYEAPGTAGPTRSRGGVRSGPHGAWRAAGRVVAGRAAGDGAHR